MNKKVKDRILAIFMTIVVLLPMVINDYLFVSAAIVEDALIDNKTVSVSSSNITLDLGVQGIYDITAQKKTYAYKEAILTGNNVKSLLISFVNGATAGSDSIILPTTTGFTLNSGNNDYKLVGISANVTTQEVETYIRNIQFTLGNDEKDIMIVALEDETTYETYYNYVTRHFYQFVPFTSDNRLDWIASYDAALSMSYAGRTGYLATLEKASEDKFLMNITTNRGWLGGTRLTYNSNTGKFSTASQALTEENATTIDAAKWYWACGPEKGTMFYRYAVSSDMPYGEYKSNSSFSAMVSIYDTATKQVMGEFGTTYFNWNRNTKDYENYSPRYVSEGDTYGSCLVNANYGKGYASTSGYSWYDVSWNCSSKDLNAPKGFFVEYGDKKTGDTSEYGNNSSTKTLREMKPEATPFVSIDYINEKLKGFNVSKLYILYYTADGDTEETEVSLTLGADGTIAIDSAWFGKKLEVVVLGDDITTVDSARYVLNVPNRPARPEGILGTNRTLSGVDSTLQYRKEGEIIWNNITGTKVQRLDEGTYELRKVATSTTFKSDVFKVEVLTAGAVISIDTNKRVDVALAVGSTTVDYSNFENDLREYLANQGLNIPKESLNIMATSAVDTSGKSDFAWLQFDHSASSAIYGSSSYPYIQDTNINNQSSANEFNTLGNHIVSTNNGSTLNFFGYGVSGYADFMLLENEQQTKKSFQFSIKEYYAADALYGTGFFFNSNMRYATSYASNQAAYAASALFMDGYIAVLEYTGNAVSALSVYQFEGLNLYNYHNFITSSSAVQASMTACGATVTKLATMPVNTTVNDVKLSTADDLRKFRIDVSPTSVQVYYKGFDDTSHSVTTITASSAAGVFDPNNAGYQAFIAQSYDDLPLVLSATLPKTYGGSDFGPMTKYGSHGCGSLTKVELSELSMTMEVVRSLSEVLREPKWRDGTEKFLINLNEAPINDFDNASITAELLNRLKNDDIYYIGWCSDTNAIKSDEFLKKNDLKGDIISIKESTLQIGDNTVANSYDAQIARIAYNIALRYTTDTSENTDLILNTDDNKLNVLNADRYNTVDEEWPDGKWLVDYYKDSSESGLELVSSTWMSDLVLDFEKLGTYKVYYCFLNGDDNGTGIDDEPIKTLIVHSAPTALFSSSIAGTTAVLTSNSYDEDGSDLTYKWYYKDLGTSSVPKDGATVEILDTTASTTITGLTNDHIYLVTLEVTDKYGVTSAYSNQISVGAAVKVPPVAFFALSNSTFLFTTSSTNELNVIDSSYDPASATITKRTFTLYDASGKVLKTITLDSNGKYNITSLATGEYSVGLVVESANGKSSEVKRSFTVVNDKDKPTATPSLSVGTLAYGINSVTLTFTDIGGSGYKNNRYCITNSTATPTEAQWSAWSVLATRTVEFNIENQSYYIHYQIADNAGNVNIGYVGAYTREQVLVTPSGLLWEGNGATPVLKWTGDTRINGNNPSSYTITIYKDNEVFDVVTGLTSNTYSASQIVRGGDGEYTYKVQALSEGSGSANNVEHYNSAVSSLSSVLTYKIPENIVVSGGALTLTNPITQEQIDEVFGGYAELVSTDPLTIKLLGDVILEDSIIISEDIVIDLNGHSIIGPSGDINDKNGKPAIIIDSDNVELTIKSEGEIKGGSGSDNATEAGNGASAIDFGKTTGGELNLGKDAAISGGDGGSSSGGKAGNGGSGVSGDEFTANIRGDVAGGNGGNGTTLGGDGGSAIETQSGTISIASTSEIAGGNGGSGTTGGNGGSGINAGDNETLTGDAKIDIESGANISGGDGGKGTTGTGGNGGSAVNLNDSEMDNKGTLSGGTGGSSTSGTGGSGGNAVTGTDAEVSNDGVLEPGSGGKGKTKGLDGKQEAIENIARGGTLNDGFTQDELDVIFGIGNTIYDEETNTIIILNDIVLQDTVVIETDVNINLNGNKIEGPSAVAPDVDGKAAIKVGDDVDLGIYDTSKAGTGSITGGKGSNGVTGGDGGNAIDFGTSTDSAVIIGENVTISGGAGGTGTNGDGGNGGSAIIGENAEVISNGNLAGGQGGYSANGTGGNGGTALDMHEGTVEINGTATGGNGGTSTTGNGGAGGTALSVENCEVEIDGLVKGGNGGISGEMSGGNGGAAIDSLGSNVSVAPDSKITGGNGGTGQIGGNGGTGINAINTELTGEGDVAGGNGGTGINPGTAGLESISKNIAPGGTLISPLDQDKVDDVFGRGNATYDEETNTIILNHDVELEDSIVIMDDVVIDLNGNGIAGPSSDKEGVDGKPAIVVAANDVELDITDTIGGGSITGGNGFDGTTGSNGGNAIDFGNTTGGLIVIDQDIVISGGNGGNGINGNGGNGGDAINGKSVDADINGDVIGGNGGYGLNGQGGDGGAAIDAGSGNVLVNEEASIEGGNGGNGEIGGNGGSAIVVDGNGSADSGNIAVKDGASVAGGDGGSGIDGDGGAGGSAIEGNNAEVVIEGTITGGAGGSSESGNGGNGGPAIDALDSDVVIDGLIIGGDGGNSENGIGGHGGNAIDTQGTDITVENQSGIIGGSGGDGQMGGAGGSAIKAEGEKDAEISIKIGEEANIIGGNGGSSETGTGGTGGNGIDAKNAETTSEGNIMGGTGGTGAKQGADGKDSDAQNVVPGGKLLAPLSQEKVDDVFGEGNAIYDEESNTITLINDVVLDESIEIEDDVTIDLNGNNIVGPKAKNDTEDGKPAIVIVDDNVDLNITDSQGGGSIAGGAGADGENGTNGGNAIDFGSTTGGLVVIDEDVKITGGNGGTGTKGNGGSGGSAISGDSVDADVSGDVSGGDGGYGSKGTGGTGGSAIDAGNGSVTIEPEASIEGGTGGSGEIGGNGGSATKTTGNGEVIVKDGAALEGGTGGNATTGPKGEAGVIVDDKKAAPGGKLTTPLDQAAIDAVFGPGNATYDEDTNTIILDNNIVLDDSIVIEGDVILDLNGNNIIGPSGKTDGEEGKPAIKVDADDVELVITDSVGDGAIKGGNGADGTTGGDGGKAIDFGDTTGGKITVTEDATVIGGKGGNGSTGTAGNGGTAIGGDSIDADISGDVKGGDGGYAPSSHGGNGGNAVDAGNGNIVTEPSANIEGGSGGNGEIGGNGGSATKTVGDGTQDSGNITVKDGATIEGGTGGNGITGPSGHSGATVDTFVEPAPGGTLTLPLNQSVVDNIFGIGNATYDESTNTITLNNDIILDNPIVIKDDVVIDLNGHDIVGPSGKTDGQDGKSAIIIDSNNVEIIIEDSLGGGTITGGDGADGTAGGNGGNAIDFGKTTGGKITVNDDITINGGNGGNATTGKAGDGGSSIKAKDVEAVIEGNVSGGTGGYSSTGTGGNGGAAIATDTGEIIVDDEANVIGGNGGNSGKGKGGTGGDAIDGGNVDTAIAGIVTGGTGGNGKKGTGQDGADLSGASAIYKVILVTDKLKITGKTEIQPSTNYEAKIELQNMYANNKYLSIASTAEVYVNGAKQSVNIVDTYWISDPTTITYCSQNGSIFVPAKYVTSSIKVVAYAKPNESANVSTYAELENAIAAGVKSINIISDIVLSGNLEVIKDMTLTINDNAKLDLNSYSITNKGTMIVNGIVTYNGGSIVKASTGTVNYKVSLAEGEGYTLSPSVEGNYTVNDGDNYTFKFELAPGYAKSSNFKVKVNGTEVVLDANDTYTISNVSQKPVVTIEGVVDVIAPSGAINIKSHGWNALQQSISYNIFAKPTELVTIIASDNESGVNAVYYYVTNKKLTQSELTKLDSSNWTNYTGEFEIGGSKERVVYSKIVDNGGNVLYISSNGIYAIDKAPAIIGMSNNTAYYTSAEFIADNTTTSNITVDGVTITTSADGKFSITAIGKHEVVITDMVGNVTTYQIRILQTDEKRGIDSEEVKDTNNYVHGLGDITITVDTKDSKKAAVTLPDANNAINSILNEDELKAVEEGAIAQIKVVINDNQDSISQNDKQAIIDAIKVSEIDGLKIGIYFDIEVFYKLNDEAWQKVSRANDEILFTVEIPESMRATGRDYYIIRNHDGIVEVLEDLDNDPNTITFKTKLFSTYAIGYSDESASIDDPSKTSDSNSTTMLLVTMAAMALALIAVRGKGGSKKKTV